MQHHPHQILPLPILSPPQSRAIPPVSNLLPTIKHDVHLNHKTILRSLFHYPLGTSVEYPETSIKGSVGHLFEVLPDDWSSPRLNFAYSQGVPTGQTQSGQ